MALGGASLGCSVTTHPQAPAGLGVARSSSDLEAVIDVPGPVAVETVAAADWEVARSGLIRLDHPKAAAAGLEDGAEPIQIYFHALRHPARGIYLVDTGVERALHADPEHAAMRGLVVSVMNVGKMRIHVDTASWIARQREPIAGVFFTHLHLDHVIGTPDIPRGTPLYAGPGEASASGALNLFIQPDTDRAFEGHAPIGAWGFRPDPDRRFAGVLDVFGDRTVWALWTPGHTPGSTAYVARTPAGPVMLTGDTCHTAWGWEHEVEPGDFTADQGANAAALKELRALAERHPSMDVRLGHQALPARERPSEVAISTGRRGSPELR
ncbi:MAG: MBL fold metallo-hydrolase [Polyangiaceae bacterium]|nr:MBL fold metallo-hydrolase [Polyangiaceae bacterium]